MRSISLVVCLAMVSPSAVSAAPIQWPATSGGNNHYYDLAAPPTGITWTDARAAAAATTFQGVNGHLVTIADMNEWTFVTTQFPRDWTWIGLSDEAQEGVFKWVTNEPLTFTRWIPGEPNNAGGIEDYVFYQRSSGLGGDWGWNDFPNFQNVFTGALPIGYVVEFDIVPEPSSWALALVGCVIVASASNRTRNRLRRESIPRRGT